MDFYAINAEFISKLILNPFYLYLLLSYDVNALLCFVMLCEKKINHFWNLGEHVNNKYSVLWQKSNNCRLISPIPLFISERISIFFSF